MGTSFPFIMASSADTKTPLKEKREQDTHTCTHTKEILEGRGKGMLCN